MQKNILTLIVTLTLQSVVSTFAGAQTASLHTTPTRRMEERATLTLNATSFTARPQQSPRTFRKHDLVTVVAKKIWRSENEGEMERKRKMNADYSITNWFSLSGLKIGAASFTGGKPAIGGKIDSQFKNDSSITRRDLLEFKITCSVEAVLENGVLLLEGTDTVTINEEIMQIEFIGYARPEDIQADNTILSERCTGDIKIITSGSVYDGYRRNWGSKLIDRYSPF
ncbi:MAG: flagellar basal body L-ring protein FlgH [Planctomycetaceae bacterium]|jgi:flagellar L-ring protein precursor FlgH|nr:flagellar basal body L-ring protein FlgH [Planctomycetaceae bacterium]